MSEAAAPAVSPALSQHKVMIPPATVARIEDQAEALGFVSGNALSAVWLTAAADVPASRVWEVLAAIRRTHPAKKGRRHA